MTINTNFHFDKRFMDNAPTFGDTVLYQIGRLHSNSRTKVDTHIHGDLYELTVVTDGCGVITTNGVPVEVNRGDIYLSFPCDTHKIESDREKLLKYDFFAFNTASPKLREQFEQIVLDHSSAENRVFRDERVSALVGNAISEFDRELFCSKELLENIFSNVQRQKQSACSTAPAEVFSPDGQKVLLPAPHNPQWRGQLFRYPGLIPAS